MTWCLVDSFARRNAGYAFIHINDERSRDLLTAKQGAWHLPHAQFTFHGT